MFRFVLAALVAALVSSCSLAPDDSKIRIGVSYDHREGSVEGSQQFFPSATARIEEEPIIGGWVELEMPFGPVSVSRIEVVNWSEFRPAPSTLDVNVENWRDLKPESTPTPTHPKEPTAVIAPNAKVIKLFGTEIPADVITLTIILVFGIPAMAIGSFVALKLYRRRPEKEPSGAGS